MNKKTKYGETPLSIARKKNKEVVEDYLLEHGAVEWDSLIEYVKILIILYIISINKDFCGLLEITQSFAIIIVLLLIIFIN